MPTRVAVFVDYMNCYRRAREAFCVGSRNHVDGQVDPLRPAVWIGGRRVRAHRLTEPDYRRVHDSTDYTND